MLRQPLVTRVLMLATLGLLVVACGTANRAPVVSREPGLLAGDAQRPAFYQVRPGDTLYAIAWQAGVDYRDLAAWNGIRNPELIHAGQRLRLWPAPGQHHKPVGRKPAPKTEPKPQAARSPAIQVTRAPKPASPNTAAAKPTFPAKTAPVTG